MWALFCHIFSWFIFYVLVRPYSNSIETICTTAALAHWPWHFLQSAKKDDDKSNQLHTRRLKALAFAALGVLFRPTNGVLWVYLGAGHLLQSHDPQQLLLRYVLPIGILTVLSMLAIDFLGYGVLTFVPWNFIKFNVLEGKDRLYGEHPWNWYFAQGFPAIVGTVAPLFIAGWLTAPTAKKELGRLIIWSLFVYSFSAHKGTSRRTRSTLRSEHLADVVRFAKSFASYCRC
ncbi:hypothetical protein PINS_up000460 [Pythium insidiosum]|nr:hypothetical protein PINS_up000460 [Pythium insidiosum]